MKKILSLMLAIVLVFSVAGCSKPASVSSTSNKEKYGYYTFENFDWGMSKQECLDVMGISESETTKLVSSEAGYSRFSIERKVFGFDATIVFDFRDDINGKDVGLALITINYKDKENRNEIFKQFIKTIKADADIEDVILKNEHFMQQEYVSSIEDKELVDKIVNAFSHKIDREKTLRFPISQVYFYYEGKDSTWIKYTGLVPAIINTVLKSE